MGSAAPKIRPLMVTAAVLMATAGLWAVIVYRQRTDVRRCPTAIGMRATSVGIGPWGEGDTCNYVDAAGRAVTPDANLARPFSSTPFSAVVTPGAIVAVLAGYALSRASRRPSAPLVRGSRPGSP